MDLILFNGKIETMNPSNPRAEAAAVKNGKFVKVGSNEEVKSLKTDGTQMINLNGSMVVPGFNDSHMHLAMYGANLMECDLVGIKSVEELIERMKNFIRENNIKPGRWVTGKGWNNDYFSVRKLPTKHDLDKISTEHYICVTRTCYHVCVVNSKALEVAGITADSHEIDGGKFDVDENGVPVGICRENALKFIYSKLPSFSVDDIKKMITGASGRAVTKGITSIQTDDFMVPGTKYEDIIRAYKELNEEGRLPVRVYEQCLLPTIESLKSFIDRGHITGTGNDFFKIGPFKCLADGSLGTRTAYLREPYSDDPTTSGIAIHKPEALEELIITAHNAGMQLAVHAIGDKTMYMVLEYIEKACRQNPRKDPRHTIVHCMVTDSVLIDKFKQMDLVACIQPIFLDYDLHMAEDRLGRERVKTAYNWRRMYDKGIRMACSSDCPVEPFDVLPGIYEAVTRKDIKGYPEGGWMPGQKITVYEALHGFTLGAAYASFEEDIKGSIEEGKLADMAVLSSDIFEIEPDKIKDVEITMTFVNGQLVYEK